jgi:hypothetical protein
LVRILLVQSAILNLWIHALPPSALQDAIQNFEISGNIQIINYLKFIFFVTFGKLLRILILQKFSKIIYILKHCLNSFYFQKNSKLPNYCHEPGGGDVTNRNRGFGLESRFIRIAYNHNKLQPHGTFSSTTCTNNL